MRVAVYGGSFNPPHLGHGLVAAWLRWSGRADAVWLLPTFAHPFGKVLAPWAERLALCESLARVVGPFVHVCPVEADLPMPSFTIDTLDALAGRHPEHRFRFVVGADVVPETPKWRRWDDIQTHYSPIVVGRQGWPTPPGAVDFPGVSSTEVRARAAAGESIDHLVTATSVASVRRLYAKEQP